MTVTSEADSHWGTLKIRPVIKEENLLTVFTIANYAADKELFATAKRYAWTLKIS